MNSLSKKGKQIVFGILAVIAVVVLSVNYINKKSRVVAVNEPPVVVPPVVETSAYTDPAHTFSFAYPNRFSLFEGDKSSTTDWMQNTTNKGALLVSLSIPKNFEPQTNFSELKFTVGKSVDAGAVATCLSATNGSVVANPSVMINGVSYAKITLNDAGAGNFYDTTSYRTIRDKTCYAIEYTIHSTNIGNYSPDQGIKEFDKAKVQNIAEDIVQSFKFY